ncbi:MAG TPA: cobalamin biosynthesis protein CobD [Candidatus Caccomorpha excrementavium]|nr:cobalamin biosynthesis protein CobD [Candidatus Caccomorpha excrementavium]
MLAGILTVILIVGITVSAALLALWIAGLVHPVWRLCVESIMCYQMLAAKSLRDESMKVYDALQEGDILKARKAVSMIVGRDTDRLDSEGIAKAAVETVAENTSDGVIAPMFYMAFFGAAGGFVYKAVNTMDSMIGYKNETYLYFGRAAAKFDDIVNYIPARISALLMIGAAYLSGADGRGAVRIWKRDRRNHASPNSAQTEAVCAGALGVRLAGDAWYFGTLYKKKTIGDPVRNVVPEDIRRANRLMYLTSLLGMIPAAAVRLLIGCLL